MTCRLFTVAVVLLVGSLTASLAHAQAIFESSDGESSLALRSGGLLHINFADASVSFGLVRQVSTDRVHFGIDGKLNAKDGFVSIVSDGFALGGGQVTGFLGRDFSPRTSMLQYQFVGVRVEYTHSSFDIVPDGSATLEAISTPFNGSTVGGFYNAFIDTARGKGGGQELLLGVAIDYGRRNNADSLDEVQVCDAINSLTTSAQTVRTVSKCKTASVGAYETSNRVTASVDLLWYQRWSSNRIAVAFTGRYDELKHRRPFVPGFGIFVTESGAPLKVQGGITIEAIDGKPRFGLQVGFPF